MTSPALLALIRRHQAGLSPADGQFLERVYSAGPEPYRARLEQYGFHGLDRVLDAGCGFGQWSLALSETNHQVDACDGAPARIAFLAELAAALERPNLRARVARLEALPYPDAAFDAVFAYSSLYFTPWKESLRELARVLRPGGLIYLNACGLGWYKHLWYGGARRDDGFDPRSIAARVLLNTYRYQRGEAIEDGLDILIEPSELGLALEELDFIDLEEGAEGTLGRLEGPARPFFRGDYLGDRGVYEMLARKSGGAGR
jgi:SAM-dependent methyltransferase